MGESILITAIEVIIQERRTLLQIDFEYSESKTTGRIFIDSQDFFKKLKFSQDRQGRGKGHISSHVLSLAD